MVGHRHIGHWMYFIVCWLGLSPCGIVFILVFASYDYEAVSYNGVEFPPWGEAIGWLVACSSIIMIPFWAIWTYCEKSGHYKYIVLAAQPEDEWGPALAEDREGTEYQRSADKRENNSPGIAAKNYDAYDNTQL